MPTPAKPYTVLKNEKKSHRTKAELSARKQGEEELMTSESLKERKEVKDNKFAHKEFLRIEKLLKNIGKNDAIYEAVINRYCMLQAECKEAEELRATYESLIQEIRAAIPELSKEDTDKYLMELVEISKSLARIAAQIAACDKILGTKRKMLLDIEKENVMTVAAALRTIPKKEEKADPLLQILKGS